jgi:DegV family protein with EDD domain
MKWKIVADTGSNIREINNLPENVVYDIIPLILHVENKDFVDVPTLNIRELLDAVKAAPESSSACPAPGVYAEKFSGADNVICFTISSELSGSYNSAELGKNIALEDNPDANIYIFNSRSAGGEMDLLVEKAVELIKEGKEFQEVVDELHAYHEQTFVGFMLKSIENLVKNGHVSKMVGSVVGLLNINVIGVRSEEGTIEMSNRARGEKRALKTFINDILENGYNGKRMEIGHVDNLPLAEKFANQIKEKFADADINIRPTSGLCSFYAEDGGLIVGYERN